MHQHQSLEHLHTPQYMGTAAYQESPGTKKQYVPDYRYRVVYISAVANPDVHRVRYNIFVVDV